MPVTARKTIDIGDSEVKLSGVVRESFVHSYAVPGISVPIMAIVVFV